MLSSILKKQAEIKELQSEIDYIQNKCIHPATTLKKQYCGSIGWDYEKYWARFHCLRCDKKWTVDSTDTNEYNREACIIME